ncbi:MAG: Lsr2 family protein [Bifidobacteriaceae bacterium]|jgi:hypothetical protein|nr:Lsr2 family protein [Bifidobacteriaceae bacterium]
MAQRVVVEFLDDIDQSPNATTVTFGIDGVDYAIDLNDRHAAELRGLLEPYAKAGRRPGSKRPPLTPTATEADPAAVRAWADSNRIEVSKRGRIPAWVVDRYHAAGY